MAGDFKWTLLIQYLVLSVKIETGILTRYTHCRAHPAADSCDDYLSREVMITLETSVEIVMIHANIMMCVSVNRIVGWSGPHGDVDWLIEWIAMMTEARETMTEALITGQAVVGRVFGHWAPEGLEIQGRRRL